MWLILPKLMRMGILLLNRCRIRPNRGLFELVIQKKGGVYYPNRLENDDPNTSNYFPIVYKNGETIVIKTDAAHFQRNFAIEKPSAENAAMLQLRDIRQNGF